MTKSCNEKKKNLIIRKEKGKLKKEKEKIERRMTQIVIGRKKEMEKITRKKNRKN
jgi:hypothetical protein